MKKLKNRPKELKGLKPDTTKRARDYFYTKVDFFIKDKNLYIKFTGHKVKVQWFVLRNFRQYTALEVFKKISDGGRHFEDGILTIWKNERLEFG